MEIDASIYGQIQQPQIESPINALAKVTQLKNAQNQNRLFDMQVADSERARAGENALSAAYRGATGADGTIDRNKLFTSIASGGQGAKLPGIQKGLADTDKSTADAQKSQLDAAGKNAEIVGQYMTAAKQNPALYPQLLAELRQKIPGGGKDLPDQYEPGIVDATITKALTVKDQIAAKQKELDQVLARDKFAYDKTNDAANRGVTIRGQNLTNERARDANNVASSGNVIKAETDLRKEFADLPEVKNYKAAYPSFQAVKQAATRTGPQADINLIYGIAKLYDPTSVVREGEYATIANSQSIPEKVKSLAQQLAGGGKLTPKTKQDLMKEAASRIGTYETEYQKSKGSYEGVAKQRGADSANVFTDAGSFKTVKVGGQSLSARQAPDGKFYVEQNGKFFEVQ